MELRVDAGAEAAERVHLFLRGPGTPASWTEAKLFWGPVADSDFGDAVALDGDTLAIAAPRAGAAGEVYVYLRDEGGPGNWGLAKTIPAPVASFASFGVELSALTFKEITKGKTTREYLWAEKTVVGRPALEVLAELIPQWIEALPFAKAALEERPDIPTPWFNLLSCAAEAGEEGTFERGLHDYAALYRTSREPLMRRWLRAEAEVLASQTHLSAAEILRLGGVDDAPSPGEDV